MGFSELNLQGAFNMLFSQYCRIETRAGGLGCTNVEFIRAAHKSLHGPARFNHRFRADRHAWLRDGLALLAQSRGASK